LALPQLEQNLASELNSLPQSAQMHFFAFSMRNHTVRLAKYLWIKAGDLSQSGVFVWSKVRFRACKRQDLAWIGWVASY
jgi:hypothetical protein